MSESACFNVTRHGKVAQLELCRPDELNTMTPEFWRDLPPIVEDLSGAGDVRAIVVTSTGRHFSAGMDLAVFTGGSLAGGGDDTEVGRQRANLRRNVLHLQETFTCFERARMPVIAAIQGGCIGGAVDMVTACDMRLATTDAFFCIQEINIGMTADVGTLQRLPKIIPEGIARQLAYTGERMSADRAREVGLVNEVFGSHDELVESTLEIAQQIASKSPLAIWGTKESLNYSRDHTVADALDFIATWQTGMFQPADMAEALTARGEKREPSFDDLAPLRQGL